MMTTTSPAAAQPASPQPITRSAALPAMGGVLRAVIRKELQQNWVNLALVICLEFIIVCVAEWFRSGWLFDSWNNNQIHNVLLMPAVQSAITLGCAVSGLLLGVLQPLADRNFDLWAFLNHRPVPRAWLYGGRVLAGLILYGIAAGLPVGFAMIIAPTKMGGAFFLWQYLLPPLADWVAGLVFYFAGLLIMERQVRWYGSRLAPLLLAVAGSLGSLSVESFWAAVGISGVLIVLYGAASMGSAVSHGFMLRSPRRYVWALGMVLFVGYLLLCMAPTATALARVLKQADRVGAPYGYTKRQFWTRSENLAPVIDHYVQLMPDATFANVTQRYSYDPETEKWVQLETRTDAAGHPIPNPTEAEVEGLAVRSHSFVLHPREDARPVGYRELGYHVSTMTAPIWKTKQENVWYWVPDRHIFYVYRQPSWDAYAQETDRIKAWKQAVYLGTFGSNGLDAHGNSVPFDHPLVEDPYAERPLVQTPHVLYRIDLEHVSIESWFTAEPGETIFGQMLERTHAAADAEPLAAERSLLVATDKRIVKLSADDTIILSIPLRAEAHPDYVGYTIFPKERKVVLSYVKRPQPGAIQHAWERTYDFFNEAGKPLDTRTISNEIRQSTFEPTLLPNGRKILARTEYRAGAVAAAGGQVVTGLAWVAGGYANADVGNRGAATRMATTAVPIMLAWAVGAWVLAGLYAQRGAKRLAWTAFGFLAGPAALLTFLGVQRLPRWARCPACRRLRLRREGRCPFCKASWPKPEVTGTEIWAAQQASLEVQVTG